MMQATTNKEICEIQQNIYTHAHTHAHTFNELYRCITSRGAAKAICDRQAKSKPVGHGQGLVAANKR